MHCFITKQTVQESDVFAKASGKFGEIVFSHSGVLTLPVDLRRSPLMDILVKHTARLEKPLPDFAKGSWIFVTDNRQYFDVVKADQPIMEVVEKRINQWADRVPNFVYHLIDGGTYIGSARCQKPVRLFLSPEWVFSNPVLTSVSGLLADEEKNRWQYIGEVLVVTKGQGSAGISNCAADGTIVRTVKMARDAVGKIIQPGFKYYILNDGRVWDTITTVTDVNREPIIGWSQKLYDKLTSRGLPDTSGHIVNGGHVAAALPTEPIVGDPLCPIHIPILNPDRQPDDEVQIKYVQPMPLVIPKVAVGRITISRVDSTKYTVHENGISVGCLKFTKFTPYIVEFVPTACDGGIIVSGYNKGCNTDEELTAMAVEGLLRIRTDVVMEDVSKHVRNLIQRHDIVIGVNT